MQLIACAGDFKADHLLDLLHCLMEGKRARHSWVVGCWQPLQYLRCPYLRNLAFVPWRVYLHPGIPSASPLTDPVVPLLDGGNLQKSPRPMLQRCLSTL
jgi:hypothetical protein